MKLALAQIDMRLGDIEGICGRIEDQARLAHERGARVLCVPAPLFMGAMPGSLVGAADFEHDMLTGLTGVAERIQELDMICIVPAAVSFEGQPLLDYMMLKDGRVVRTTTHVGHRRCLTWTACASPWCLTWIASSRCCRPASTSLPISSLMRLT